MAKYETIKLANGIIQSTYASSRSLIHVRINGIVVK